MRIAIDARFLSARPSPLAQYSENLLEHLAQVDKENEYVVFIHASFPKTLRLGENFRVRPLRGAPISWRTLTRFHKRVARAEADVLHCFYPVVPLFYRGPLVVTIHDLKPLLAHEAQPERFFLIRRLAEGVSRWVFPIAVRRATWLLAVSNTTRQGLSDLFPEALHKTVVTHSGLEPSYQTPLEKSTLDLVRAKRELPDRYCFYTGGVRPSKNVAKLLTAFAELRGLGEAFEPVHLILDSPPDRWLAEIKKLVRRLHLEGAVHFFEQVADPERRALYAMAQAFCFLCKDEGFGLPILEAQASGIPVLAADSGALPEVAGRGAVLVNPDHVPSIVEGLRLVLTSEGLRRELIQTGHENARKYSWKKTAEQVREIYDLLL